MARIAGDSRQARRRMNRALALRDLQGRALWLPPPSVRQHRRRARVEPQRTRSPWRRPPECCSVFCTRTRQLDPCPARPDNACRCPDRSAARYALQRFARRRWVRSAIFSGRTDRLTASPASQPFTACSRARRRRPSSSGPGRRTALHGHVEEIGLADEIGDEMVDRPLDRFPCGVPTCCTSPSDITAMRSDMVSASSWSWVTKMKVMPVSS